MTSVTFCAGRTRADTDSGILQHIDTVLGRDTGDGEAEYMGRFMCAVNNDTVQCGELFHKAVKQRFFLSNVLPESLRTCCTGCCKTENSRCAFCSAAVAAFLSTAQQQGRVDLSLGLI